MTRFLATLSLCTLAATAVAAPKQICDDDWSIKPKAAQAEFVQLDRTRPVLVDLRGIKHAAKGFLVRVLPADVWESFVAKKVTVAALNDYDNEHVTSYHQTKTLKPGRWAIVVENSDNLLERAVVHAHIVVDPDPG